MDSILNIVYEYSLKNKLLDELAIGQIFDIIIKLIDTNDKITYNISNHLKCDISNLWNKRVLGEYDMHSDIYIYYKEMLLSIHMKKYKSKYDKIYPLTINEVMMQKNMFILETILHEMEHYKQVQMIKDIYNGSCECQIYRYEFDFINPYFDIYDTGLITYYMNALKNEMIYFKNYNLSFMERMANINSSEAIYQLLKELGYSFNNLGQIQRKIIDDYIIKGYKNDLNGPTTKFIHNIGHIDEFNKYELPTIIDNMSFDDRLKYGFKITDEEYKKKVMK